MTTRPKADSPTVRRQKYRRTYRVRWHRMWLDGGVADRGDLRLLLQVVHPLMEILLVVAGH